MNVGNLEILGIVQGHHPCSGSSFHLGVHSVGKIDESPRFGNEKNILVVFGVFVGDELLPRQFGDYNQNPL